MKLSGLRITVEYFGPARTGGSEELAIRRAERSTNTRVRTLFYLCLNRRLSPGRKTQIGDFLAFKPDPRGPERDGETEWRNRARRHTC
jgi:hypothetical protein